MTNPARLAACGRGRHLPRELLQRLGSHRVRPQPDDRRTHRATGNPRLHRGRRSGGLRHGAHLDVRREAQPRRPLRLCHGRLQSGVGRVSTGLVGSVVLGCESDGDAWDADDVEAAVHDERTTVSFQIVNPPTIGGLGLIDETDQPGRYAAYRRRVRHDGIRSRHFDGQPGRTATSPSWAVRPAAAAVAVAAAAVVAAPSRCRVEREYFNSWRSASSRRSPSSRSTTSRPARGRCSARPRGRSSRRRAAPTRARRSRRRARGAKLNLVKPFKKKKLPVGTKLTVTITATGFIGKRSPTRCASASGRRRTLPLPPARRQAASTLQVSC